MHDYDDIRDGLTEHQLDCLGHLLGKLFPDNGDNPSVEMQKYFGTDELEELWKIYSDHFVPLAEQEDIYERDDKHHIYIEDDMAWPSYTMDFNTLTGLNNTCWAEDDLGATWDVAADDLEDDVSDHDRKPKNNS